MVEPDNNRVNWADLPSSLLGMGRGDLYEKAMAELPVGEPKTLRALWRYWDAVETVFVQAEKGTEASVIISDDIYHMPVDLNHLRNLEVSVPEIGERRRTSDAHYEAVALGMVRLHDSHQGFLNSQPTIIFPQENGNS